MQQIKLNGPIIIRNEILYDRTKEKLLSTEIRRRLKWTGHLLRLPEKSPDNIALVQSQKCNRNQKKTNKLTWLKQTNKDLSSIDKELTLDKLNVRLLAEDREL